MQLPDFTQGIDLEKFTYIALVMQFVLRGLSEGLGKCAAMLQEKGNVEGASTIQKLAGYAGTGLNAVTWAIGLFGVGTPKNTQKPKTIGKMTAAVRAKIKKQTNVA